MPVTVIVELTLYGSSVMPSLCSVSSGAVVVALWVYKKMPVPPSIAIVTAAIIIFFINNIINKFVTNMTVFLLSVN